MGRTIKAALLAIAATGLAAGGQAAGGLTATPLGQDGAAMRAMMKELGSSLPEGEALDRLIAEAAVQPLGSAANPIRADGPGGQRAYLRRLRCGDGAAPRFDRRGNVGPGPFGTIVDLYDVRCADGSGAEIHMDMYHEHVEARAPAGFTIADDMPRT